VEQAASLEGGELWHGDHRNPATGEEEDTDVGFPGSEHHIAEREAPMRAAMIPLALLSIGGGIAFVPGVTDWLERFLQPVFRDSRLAEQVPSTGAEWAGLVVGAILSVVGIGSAWFVYVRDRGYTLMLRDRYRRLHDFLAAKWYFDELYEALVVRPTGAFARFGNTVVESTLVQGVIVGGAAGLVRSGTSFARAIQSGYLRAYALVLVAGLSAVGLYFLLQAS
jgi:NADH-quinone oxidoreductase subunit L